MSHSLESIGDHCQFPRNRRSLAKADATGRGTLDGSPPFVTLYLEIRDDVICSATYEAAGCGITVACGSTLTEWLHGRSVGECREATAEMIMERFTDFPAHKSYCAVVAARALNAALADYDGRRLSGGS